MLHWETLPQEFKNQVSLITMGKWVGCGLILANKKHHLGKELTKKLATCEQRGYSTMMTPEEPGMIFYLARKKLKEIPDIRKKVLTHLSVDEKQCWGQGILIFCTKRKD